MAKYQPPRVKYSDAILIYEIHTETGVETYLSIQPNPPISGSVIYRLGYGDFEGLFWENVLRRLAELGGLSPRLVLESECDANSDYERYIVRGKREDLETLAIALTPFLDDEDTITEFIQAGEADGWKF
ncbi:MAG: hypothetical protein Q4C87_08435 [Actinomycetaceae bacterium]|nr:hypothetical protein [Actinomycetaceae bacterium]